MPDRKMPKYILNADDLDILVVLFALLYEET
jgi:hypothetical protein